jgi:hypothetical protein|tara:strand:+ start:243 stop:473 length:231 start_codon:yes stop_codon:yes gene_type:complete
MSEPTYTVDDRQYQVNRFTDEGKVAFNYLLEIGQEIKMLQRKVDILQAAGLTLRSKVEDQLTEEMLSTLGDVVDGD